MSRRRQGKRNEKETDVNFWLLTYADMITLVLTFFILLYTMSNIDVIKYSQVIGSVKGALGVMDGGRTLENETGNDLANLEDNMLELIKEWEDEEEFIKETVGKLETLLEAEGIQATVNIVVDERGINIRFLDHILFDLGRSELKAEAKPLLDKVYNVLSELNSQIKVEGYTDNLPIKTAQFPSNWELSTSRATTVVRYFEERGLAGQQLSAVGYGEHRPLVPNINEENRRQNRRVDIVILRGNVTIE